jgi:UrcA family protein
MTRTIAAFAAAVALSAAAAQAETVSLSTAGYDLNTPAGAKAFYRHLSQTVASSCGGAPTNMFGSEEDRFQACYKDAMKDAVEKTQAPLVAALAGKAQIQVAAR